MVSVSLTTLALARSERQHQRAIRDLIGGALTADHFDAVIAIELAQPDNYSTAVGELVGLCRSPRTDSPVTGIVPSLLEPPTSRTSPLRVALALEAIRIIKNRTMPLVTSDSLVAIARRQGFRAANAATALAALGHPLTDWADLSQRERAAFLLGSVVRRRREANR